MLHSLSGALAAQTGGAWMPDQASTVAAKVDTLFYFILYLSVAFFVAVVAAMIVFVVKYRRRDENDRTSPAEGNRALEITWAVIPGLILVGLFFWGMKTYLDLATPPANALEVRVTAQRWFWSFDYPREGIATTNELVVPVNQPVRLTMSSTDIIHSFFVAAFRVKKDVLPNRYTVTWFEATAPGTYDLQCTEYCGTGHSAMLGRVVVKTADEYRAWVDSGGGLSAEGMSSVDFGKLLFDKKGCSTCHSIDGSLKTGPSLLNRYGYDERFADGSSLTVDDNYLRQSITEPQAKIVVGYQPVMPTYKGRLDDRQLNALIDYIKSLSDRWQAPTAAPEDGGSAAQDASVREDSGAALQR